MKNTTGLTYPEIRALCWKIKTETPTEKHLWLPILGLLTSVVVTLTYLRRNRSQAEIAEAVGVSQPTISRAIAAVVPLIAEVLETTIPTLEDLDTELSYLVDGTLVPSSVVETAS